MLVGSRNFLIVVVLAAISFAIALGLIIAIVVVRRQDRRSVLVRGDEKVISGGSSGVGVSNKYNCRTETIKMLRASQQTSCSKDEQLPLSQPGSALNCSVVLKQCGTESVIVDEGTLLVRRISPAAESQTHLNADENLLGTRTPLSDNQLSMDRSGQSWPATTNHSIIQVG